MTDQHAPAQATTPEKSAITTHVLNLESGLPAAGMRVRLLQADICIAQAVTNVDGRILLWPDRIVLSDGAWTLVFETANWYSREGISAFYPEIAIGFRVDANQAHYHIPLLLNRFGYSTYRGS